MLDRRIRIFYQNNYPTILKLIKNCPCAENYIYLENQYLGETKWYLGILKWSGNYSDKKIEFFSQKLVIFRSPIFPKCSFLVKKKFNQKRILSKNCKNRDFLTIFEKICWIFISLKINIFGIQGNEKWLILAGESDFFTRIIVWLFKNV